MKTIPDRSAKLFLRRQAALCGLICAAFLALAPAVRAGSLTFSTAGNYSWVCPPNVTSVQVECWGGGGGGGGAKAVIGAAGGGGGGCYVSYTLAVTPGTLYNLTVGAGGTAGNTSGTGGGSGGASFFGNTTAGSATGATVSAPNGKGGTGVTTAGYTSQGGAAQTTGAVPASGTAGATVNYALAGGNAASTPSSGAGSAGAGSSGSSGGGAGGNAIGSAGGAGIAGTAPGGGASGALSTGSTAYAGAVGATGQVKLTYPQNANATVNTYQTSTTWTCPSGINSVIVECWGGGGGGGGDTSSAAPGTGGGGGAGGSYIQYKTAVTPGHVYGITVGASGTVTSGGAGGAGGTSTFADNTTTTTIASVSGGGGGGLGTSGNPGTGGTPSSSFVPSTGATYAYSGSSGANGTISTTTGGAGGNGAGATGSTGGGFGGATNPTTASAGYPGNAPGGGGSGSSTGNTTTRAGGLGGAGQVQISYLNTPAVTSSAATPIGTTTATLNGNLTQLGTGTFISKGFVYSTSSTSGGTSGTYGDVSGGSAGSYLLALSGLSVNTRYYFVANATNSIGAAVSSELNFWTLANTPNAPTVGNATSASLDVTIASGDGNPSGTTYAIYETSTGKYVTSGGLLTSATPVFQTASAWGTITVTGLGGSYTFEIIAQNGANVATSASGGTTASTSSLGASKMITVLPNQTFSSGSAVSGTPTAQTAGAAFTVDLYAVNLDGVTVDTTYSGSKNITVTGPAAGTFSPSTATAVTFTSGHGTLSITLNLAVSTQITSGDGLLAGLASTAVAVNAGSATMLQVLMPGETSVPGTGSGKIGTPTTQTAGTSFNVTVNAVDPYWNVVSSSHVVEISASSDSAAPVPSSTVTLSGGTALVPFVFHTATASGWTVTAHDTSAGAYSDNTGTATLVNPGVASKLVFTSSAVTVQAGVPSGTITVQRQDQYGNPNTADANISVALSSSSTGTVTFNPASPLSINTGSSTASFTYMDTQIDSPTITASSSGLTSATQQETVNGGAPLAPTGLTRTANYPDVVLNWTAAQGVPTSYNVKRSTTSGSGFTTISTAGAVTGTTYMDSTVVAGTAYYYVVSAVNSYGESPNSSQVTATVTAPTLDLRMPLSDAGPGTTTASDTSSGGANVTATMYNSSTNATDYHGASGSGVGGASGSHAMDFSSVAYTGGNVPTSGLLAGVTTASTALGFGSVSTWTATFWFKQSALWTAGANGPRFFSLGPVASGDGGNNNLSMKFNGLSSPYTTMRFTFGNVGTTFDYNYTQVLNQWVFCAAVYDGSNLAIYIGSDTAPSVNVTNLATAAGTMNLGTSSYLFLGNRADQARPFAGWMSDFRYYTGAGDANYIESIRATSFPSAAPAGLAAVPGDGQVALSWSAVPTAVSYNVKRSTGSGTEVTITNVTTTSLTDLTVANGTIYYYVVSALNGYFESTNSTEVTAAPASANTPPTVAVSPTTTNVNCGSTITLTAAATGTPPLGYQWYDNQTNAISAATSSVLTLNNLHSAAAGNYTVIVTNAYGNATGLCVVAVLDSLPPVITLNGSSSLTVFQYSPFTDPGATANDACEGSRTVTTNGSVNPLVPGTYTLTYTASDSNGNSATNSRSVTVVSNVLLQLDLSYTISTNPTPAGFTKVATAFNATGNYTFANVAGSAYTLSFTNMKSWGKGGTTLDYDGFTSPGNGTPASFTVSGLGANVQVALYACWAWDGASKAPLFVYGGATNAVNVGTGIANPSIATLQYVGSAVADGNGTVSGTFTGKTGDTVEGQVGGMIIQVASSYSPPIITMVPASTNAECSGDVTLSASVNGANPLSYQWYDISSNPISGATNSALTLTNVHSGAAGSYTVIVTSSLGSSATNSVTVAVVDTTRPVVTVLDGNPYTNQCLTPFIDPGATAYDACAGSLSVTTNGTVNVAALGTYTISYIATDPSNNSATNTRTVRVVDTTPPVVTVLGPNPYINECHAAYVDPGATAYDAFAGNVGVTTSGTVDTISPGTYTLYYIATDPSGNSATNTRTVQVVDTTPPLITCSANVALVIPATATGTNVTFTVTAADSCDASPTVVSTPASGSFFPPGTTTVNCYAYDSSHNTNYCSFQVMVDRAPAASDATYTRAPGVEIKINIADLIAAHVTDQDNDPITLQSVGSGTNGASIVAGSTYIFYTPANNDNPDVFTYTVSDGQGGTATANIYIAVVKGVGEAKAITLTGGVATVDFAGIPGYTYDVQRSTDGMATWQVILTTNAPPLGMWRVTDDFGGNPPASAYYRPAQH